MGETNSLHGRLELFQIKLFIFYVARGGGTIQLLGRGAGVFELGKSFISPPVCNILFIFHSAPSKIFIAFS